MTGQKRRKPQAAAAPRPRKRTQADIARDALDLKQKAERRAKGAPWPDAGEETPREGMRPETYEDQPPSGALDHGGALPAMQRSKFARR